MGKLKEKLHVSDEARVPAVIEARRPHGRRASRLGRMPSGARGGGFTGAFQPARLIRAGHPTPSMSELLEIRLLGPFEVLAGGTPADVGGSKRQALLAMLALRNGRRGRRRRARRRPVGGGAPGRSAERAPSSHRPPPRGARRGVDRRLGRRVRAQGRARRRRAVRGAARGDPRRAARRRRPCRGGRGRVGAGPLARAGAAGPDRHGVVQRRGTPARDAARRRARGGLRGQARARRASRAHAGAPFGARGQPLPRAAVGAADAGALPQRPPGRRARDVPGGPARARRRAGARAGAGASAASGGDPRARPLDRRRPRRPQAPRQSPRAFDVVRRTRGRARPGRGRCCTSTAS